MRTDQSIADDVRAELAWEPLISEQGIGVAVKDGVVTLRGFVPSYAQKVAAERATERVLGVRGVVEELEVRLPSASELSDQALATRVINALEWSAPVPKGAIKPKVEKGWVTLEGTVKYAYERTGAEDTVRYLTGVVGLINNITVVPAVVSPMAVRTDIEQALKRHAELDASRITVETADGKVTLRGAVNSWVEKREAERAAWNAPGVKQVDDRLAVVVG